MTYLVTLPEQPVDRPQWFKDKYRTIMSDGIVFTDNFRDKPWTWYWNEKYEHKVRIRQVEFILSLKMKKCIPGLF